VRRAFLLALGAALTYAGGARADSAPPLGLADALAWVEAHGPDRQVAQAGIDVARAEVTTERMLPNPTLSLLGAKVEPIFSAGLQLRVPMFGQRGAHVRAAERGVDQAAAESALAGWRLRHDARVDYYAVVLADEEVAIARQVEALTGQVANMAAERFQVGAGTRLEKEQAALVHARAEQDIVDRLAAVKVARLELDRILGAPAGSIGPLTDGLPALGATPPEAELLSQARAHHPELAAIAREKEAALARAQAGRADRRPYPAFELGLDVLEPATCGHPESSGQRCVGPHGGLSFDLPIFNLNGGPIARAEAEARLAERKEVAALARVLAAVRAAYQTFEAARVRAHFFDVEYVPAAASVEKMAREGFASGKTGLLPLLEAERAVLEARVGRAEALYAVQAARADLEEASGVALSTP
jgi:outer membrane protein TolC